MLLSFDPTPGFNPANRQADFEKEPGKVRLELQNYLLKSILYYYVKFKFFLRIYVLLNQVKYKVYSRNILVEYSRRILVNAAI